MAMQMTTGKPGNGMKLSAMRKRYRFISHVRFLCFCALYLIVYLCLTSIIGELFVIAWGRVQQYPVEFFTAGIPALVAVIYLAFRTNRFI
jgi:hypothetical protein